MIRQFLLASAFALTAAPVVAQTAGEAQRDINQQQRIEQGLQNGSLNSREAGRLEKNEATIDRAKQKAASDGNVSAQEKARINKLEQSQSQKIYNQKHDAQTGNPNSASSQNMQSDVQRNINQEKRIKQGVKSGELTTHEAGKLEGQQSRIERKESNAAANGRVGAPEQSRIQNSQDRASGAIARQKHDAQTN